VQRFYSEDQKLVQESVRRFAEERVLPQAAAIDRDDVFPATLYREMAELGLFGIGLAEEAGGSGGDTLSTCIAMEELARCSGTIGNAFALPVEMARMLHEHGTDFHKSFIPGLLSAERIPATCVTEPDYGSDVAGMRSKAERDGDHYVITGTKAWVTFGSVADVILVFARTRPEPGNKSISCILVEGDRPGIIRGKEEELLGMHGLADCQITFDGVRVPVTNLLGPENGAFRMAMENFNFSRLMMSSMALGMTQAAMEDAVAYSQSRVQFGEKIASFQAVQMMLADMSTEIAASRLLIHHAARLYDAGHPIAKEAAHAKLFTTDMAMRNVSNALQIHGGNGYSREYRVERIFRDIRLSQIYEGTNQIQRLIIARQLAKEMA
jgi:alkylation response protein AidB-like acyl-CoA dehydrogenase